MPVLMFLSILYGPKYVLTIMHLYCLVINEFWRKIVSYIFCYFEGKPAVMCVTILLCVSPKQNSCVMCCHMQTIATSTFKSGLHTRVILKYCLNSLIFIDNCESMANYKINRAQVYEILGGCIKLVLVCY